MEILSGRSTGKEESADSIMEQLLRIKQQEQAIKEEVSKDSMSGHQHQKEDDSLGATQENNLKFRVTHVDASIIHNTESTTIDQVLPPAVTKRSAPSEATREITNDDVEWAQRQTLAVRLKMLGPEHPQTLTSVNNIAQILFF